MKKLGIFSPCSPSSRRGSIVHNKCQRFHTVELCVLCRWVSQICMSYPSMSGYICGSERGVLFMMWHRRMSADKWVRSVTVTAASGSVRACVFVCLCACMGVLPVQNEVFVLHDAVLTFNPAHTETHSYPVSAHTALICILSVLLHLLWEFMHDKQICSEITGSSHVLPVSIDEQTEL